MTKEKLGTLILSSERKLYVTAKTILFDDQDCADAIQETIVMALLIKGFTFFVRIYTVYLLFTLVMMFHKRMP